MSQELPEKLDLRSHDMVSDKIAELLRLFPEIRTEGNKLDFDKLKLALGESVDVGKERYGMSWPGKADCFKTIQAPSLGTLLPCPEESVNFDATENLIIEGDNLEVLKLLKKSYLGKVKMIYIDPPYNTGNDFIYPDNYSESLQTYVEYTGQIDSEGRKFGTNTDSDGRYHSKWMNMMYPRLYLAHDLLNDEGVLFVSIDDNEGANLRQCLNDIFGEDNYLATLYIQVRYEGKTLVEDSDFQKLIEQVLVYRKSSNGKLRKQAEDYSFEKFEWEIYELAKPRTIELGGKVVSIFVSGQYEIRKVPASITGLKEIWASGKILDGNSSGRFFRDYLEGRVHEDGLGVLYKVNGIGDDGLGHRYFTGPQREGATKGKYYQGVPQSRTIDSTEKKETPIPCFFVFADAFGNCRHEGSVDFRNGKKPVQFIRKLLDLGLTGQGGEIVLDFFAGSGSTGHAVLEANREDGGDRRFMLVQLPEPTRTKLKDGSWDNSAAWNSGFRTIAEITKARIRNVIKDASGSNGSMFDQGKAKNDEGYRVFKLAESNFNTWDARLPHESAPLIAQIEKHVDHIREGREADDILYELLLKSGFPLTTKVEKQELFGKTVYSVADGMLIICLERKLTLELIREIAALKPERVVCLDEGFAGNDQLKANAVQTFKTKGVVKFQTV